MLNLLQVKKQTDKQVIALVEASTDVVNLSQYTARPECIISAPKNTGFRAMLLKARVEAAYSFNTL